jgi:ligand-binding sensor domain-containing protein
LDDSTIVSFTKENGLGSNQIGTIYEDRNGIIWLGDVEGGLTSFDGQSFSVYTATNGLPNRSIIALYEDEKGNLWIGTVAGLYKKTGKKFELFSLQNLLDRNLEPIIVEILPDPGGGILCVYRRTPVIRSGIIRIRNNNPALIGPSYDYSFIGAFQDSHGNLWFRTTNRGVLKFNGKREQLDTTDHGLPGNRVSAIHEDKGRETSGLV